MKEIKSIDIIKGISRYLKANFPEYKIYEQGPEQGLEIPCFIIEQGGSNVTRRLSTSRRGIYSLDRETYAIKIICKDIREIRETAFNLKIRFNTIDTSSGLIRVNNKHTSYTTSKDEIVFTFSILMDLVTDIPDKNPMEILNINEVVNGKTN